MLRAGFTPKLVMIAVGGAFAAFVWLSLPPAPRPPGEQPGHAHGGDPAALADGIVVSVDRAAGEVTISHGPLQHLGMPPMTMAFRAGDRTLLDQVRQGDRVKFHADVLGGAFTVTRIDRVAP